MNPLAVVLIIVALLLIVTGARNKQGTLISAIVGKPVTIS